MPGMADKFLLIGFSPDELATVRHALSLIPHVPVVLHSIKTSIQQLFYDDYAVAFIKHPPLDDSDLFLIREAKHLAPWRGIVFLGDAGDAEMPRPDNLADAFQELRGTANLGAIIQEFADRRRQWSLPLSAEHITRFHKLFHHMRTVSLTALKEQDMERSLDLIFSAIVKHMDMHFIGLMDMDETAPFFLLEHSAEMLPAEVEQLAEIITHHLHLISPQAPLLTPLLHARHPLIKCNPQTTPFSLFPIIIDNRQKAWLILSLSKSDYPIQLYFSFLVHVVHYMASIFTALQRLRTLAFKDPLTGLYNRRYMEDACKRMFLLGQRYGHTVAILFIDVDQFKKINDRLGHEVGDTVLTQVAEILTRCLRQSDIIARYGGDEFLVVLPHTSVIEAVNTASRICKDAHSAVLGDHEQTVPLSLSIGVALSSGENKDFNETIRKADEALMRAKTTGGNQVLQWNAIEMEQNLAHIQEPADEPTGHPSPDTPGRTGILLVDDDPVILQYLDRLLRKQQYTIFAALSAGEAEKALDANPGCIDLLITDINLPDMNGFELLNTVSQKDPLIVKIVISSDVSADRAILAMRHGAYDIIQKPFTNDQLIMSVNRAMDYHHVTLENRGFQQKLIEIVNLKSSENRRSLEQIKEAYQCTLDTMVAMLDAREQYTSQHSIRVRDLTVYLAHSMGFKPSIVKEIAQGALLHDIGKIGIADAILLKPESLTPAERRIMEQHPQIGHSFLRSNEVLKYAAELVLSHHERWDGSGYPRGLKGDEILIGARIFSVIDCYDAIRSKRVYKPAIPAGEALQLIQQQSGKLYDPSVVELFSDRHQAIESMGQWDIVNSR